VFQWDSTKATNGSHTLSAAAYDAAGNVGRSSAVTVMVGNSSSTPPPTPTPTPSATPMPTATPIPHSTDTQAPTAKIVSPYVNSTVKSTQTVSVTSSDNQLVVGGALLLDNKIVASFGGSDFSYQWATTNSPDGPHTLQAKVEDAAGNVGSSAPVSVTVNNYGDTTPPNVYITYPPTGGSVYRYHTVNITATATDNVGVTSVSFYVNGSRVCTDPSSPYSCSWWVPGAGTSFKIQALAYDAKGNARSSTVTVFPR
jgi:hypothetical protein